MKRGPNGPQAGEIALLGAILRQAVDDARGIRRGNESRSAFNHLQLQTEAQAFLRDTAQLAPFVELMGADVTRVQSRLLHAAGLAQRGGRHG